VSFYKVTLQRATSECVDVTVEADSESEAYDIALDTPWEDLDAIGWIQDEYVSKPEGIDCEEVDGPAVELAELTAELDALRTTVSILRTQRGLLYNTLAIIESTGELDAVSREQAQRLLAKLKDAVRA
jgi:hypothetical protein